MHVYEDSVRKCVHMNVSHCTYKGPYNNVFVWFIKGRKYNSIQCNVKYLFENHNLKRLFEFLWLLYMFKLNDYYVNIYCSCVHIPK